MTTPPSGRPRLTQRIIAVSAALACALLTSCHAGTTQPTPPPTTHVATQDAPTSSSSPTATSSDALYDEAERVFRAYYKEHEKATRAGGFTTMPASMKKYVTGQFERDVTSLFRNQHRQGVRSKGGKFRIDWLRPAQQGPLPISLEVCTDATSTTTTDARGRVLRKGVRLEYIVGFSRKDGALRIAAGSSERVSSCDS